MSPHLHLSAPLRFGKALILAGTTLTFAACSFVELKPEAEHVILSNDSTSCKRIGETTVKVLDEFLYMDRSIDTISDELQTLAQNSAARMEGNAIWPISEINEGEQTFEVLVCNPR